MWHRIPPFVASRHRGFPVAPLGRRRTVALGALSLFAALPFAGGLNAQEAPCDPNVVRNAKGGALGYQSRGEHCEGLYATDVAATMMWVASLTAVFDEYDLDVTDPLEVNWKAPSAEAIRLRAHGIKRDLYYRMDQVRDAGATGWRWGTDVLAAAEIERNDIGVLGWVEKQVHGVEYPLFVPLRVTQGGTIEASSGGAGSYEMIVVPNVRLQEVYVSLARVAGVGQQAEGDYLKKDEPLGQRIYPTQRPIRIELAGFTEPGVYLVEISATRPGESAVTMDPMWIYHPGW